MNKRLLLPALPTIACMAFAAPALAAEPEAVSENWAGYEVASSSASSSGFSAVSGGWTAPTAKCTTGQATYSAFWVGLGGGSDQSSALEQAGTQADCSANGTATYYAWYELVPSAPVKLALKISPGDSVYTRVAVSGDQVTIHLADRTSGQSVDKTLTMTGATPDTSTAEWVAEAPSACVGGTSGQCTPLPLADFGTVTFHNAYATANGHTGTIGDSAWSSEAIALSPQTSGQLGGGFGGGFAPTESSYTTSSSGGATPSSLSSTGGSFTVSYGAETTSSTSGSAYGTGSSYGGYGSYGNGGGYGDYGSYGYDPYAYGYGYGYSYGYGGGGYYYQY